jgi:hypothetical protein
MSPSAACSIAVLVQPVVGDQQGVIMMKAQESSKNLQSLKTTACCTGLVLQTRRVSRGTSNDKTLSEDLRNFFTYMS